jgi:hypothetical protein
MGTTANGYPYPDDTASLAGGAQAIKALAQAADTRARITAAGRVTISVTTATTLFSKAITFPAGRFTVAPVVVATVEHSWWVASISAVTATGCTIYIRNVTTGKETASRVVDWTATLAG